MKKKMYKVEVYSERCIETVRNSNKAVDVGIGDIIHKESFLEKVKSHAIEIGSKLCLFKNNNWLIVSVTDLDRSHKYFRNSVGMKLKKVTSWIDIEEIEFEELK